MLRRLPLLIVSLQLVACTPHVDQVALHTPGDHAAAFEHGGLDRDILVHVPNSPPADPPLVVVLHGGGSDGEAMAEVTGFNRIADREGFVVLYPNALDIAHGMWRIWNTGTCFAPSCWFGVDDVGWVSATIDLVEKRLRTDPSRIYLVGYSNGGALAYQLAARMSTRFAALAVYAGTMSGVGPVDGPRLYEERPDAPLSVMTIMSEEDPRISFHGNERLAFTDASQRLVGQFWAASASCPRKAERYLLHGGAVRVTHFDGCADGTEVKQYALSGWDHEWPGPENLDCKPDDDPLRHFDAAEEMWRFFADKQRAP